MIRERLCGAHARFTGLAAGLTLFLVTVVLPVATRAAATMPHFKWGQTKGVIFLSVMVRDLDKNTVSVSLPTPGVLSFRAENMKGEKFELDLPLREDVQDDMKWEHSSRPDKWGMAVVITLTKKNDHRWDLLVSNPKKFKGMLDKDWAREDQTLEPEDEVQYMDDHSAYIQTITDKNINKILAKFSAVVVNVRYPWCTQCKSQDDTFAKAAKAAKVKGKKDTLWKKVAFAVVDAREERTLARRLGAKCDYNCEYQVFTGPDEDPVSMKSKWSDSELLSEIVKYLSPAVNVLEAPMELETMKKKNTTFFAGFASNTDPKYVLFKKVAGLMRGELVFAATFGAETTPELWPHKQNFSFKYDGTWEDNGTVLLDWIKPRAIPLLQEYDWQLREAYEKLKLPIAKVWLNDEDKNPSFDKIVQHAVRRVAKKFIGKIAFVQQKKTTYSYELRDHGLNQPEAYPAFGIASNASYNSIKFGFEITPEVASSVQDFWRDTDKAIVGLTNFCEKVLAGTWPEAHETGPVQTNWTTGMVKKLAFKSYKEIVDPERPLLIEIFGKYRMDNDKKSKEVENLAKTFEPHAGSFTVASYDTSDNYLPSDDFKREKYSSDTEWYWISKKADNAERPLINKLKKPKKDAPIKKVIEFAKKQSGLDFDVDDIMKKFEEEMEKNPPSTTTTPPPMDAGGDTEPEDDNDEEETEGKDMGQEPKIDL